VSIAGPVIALIGVVVGAVLSYAFSQLGERRRERWALSKEWRERRLQTYTAYLDNVKRIRSISQRVASTLGLDDQAPPLSRDEAINQLADASKADASSFEALALIADRELIEAARRLNRAVWRQEWFARGLLDDTDAEGWRVAVGDYFDAMNAFHECARKELGVVGELAPRMAEDSPLKQYQQERQGRVQKAA
jgi:hypothetical protein